MRAAETETGAACPPHLSGDLPLVIAHRGASGERPEHTLAAYRLAIEQGADFIEPDLVPTRDGVLIARHENELSGTTDVASLPRFAHLKTGKCIDGDWVEGWFSEDFTLDEVRCLRARERIPGIRPDNARFDGLDGIPTLADIVALVKAFESDGRRVGIYPETKHPSFFAVEGRHLDGQRIGLSLGQLLVEELERLKFVDPGRIFIQSFELGNLLELSQSVMPSSGVRLPLILLLPALRDNSAARPYDIQFQALLTGAADLRGLLRALDLDSPAQLDYARLLSGKGLDWLSRAGLAGLGPSKQDLLPAPASASPMRISTQRPLWMQIARDLSLHVHPYTLRAEPIFLAPAADGHASSLASEIEQLLAAGATGFFTDHPALGVRCRDRVFHRHPGV